MPEEQVQAQITETAAAAECESKAYWHTIEGVLATVGIGFITWVVAAYVAGFLVAAGVFAAAAVLLFIVIVTVIVVIVVLVFVVIRLFREVQECRGEDQIHLDVPDPPSTDSSDPPSVTTG